MKKSTNKKIAIKELETIELLLKAQRSSDTEAAHCSADNALCDFLIALGYEEIVEEYEKIDKWYA